MAKEATIQMFRATDRVIQDEIGQDVSAWSLVFTVYPEDEPDNALITKTTANGGILVTTTKTSVQVSLAKADTARLTAGAYWYALARNDSGHETVLSFGPFSLLDTPAAVA